MGGLGLAAPPKQVQKGGRPGRAGRSPLMANDSMVQSVAVALRCGGGRKGAAPKLFISALQCMRGRPASGSSRQHVRACLQADHVLKQAVRSRTYLCI